MLKTLSYESKECSVRKPKHSLGCLSYKAGGGARSPCTPCPAAAAHCPLQPAALPHNNKRWNPVPPRKPKPVSGDSSMKGPQKSSHLLCCWPLYCTYNLLYFLSVQVVCHCSNAKVLNGDLGTAASCVLQEPLVSVST